MDTGIYCHSVRKVELIYIENFFVFNCLIVYHVLETPSKQKNGNTCETFPFCWDVWDLDRWPPPPICGVFVENIQNLFISFYVNIATLCPVGWARVGIIIDVNHPPTHPTADVLRVKQ